ncbi:YceI family protein [Chryseolinea sp. T2]|uniref:YceI family protein n=1 Tax=Chryseolinea sp. T2 TaxID=3129255 RepID=UPI0030789B7B
MIKGFCCCLAIFCSIYAVAQTKFTTERGKIKFVSNAELEVIQAASGNLQGIIDTHNNQFAFTVLVRSFQGFNSDLQREHFNEKYIESESFPRMAFSGKIIEAVDYDINGIYEVRAKGELDIHGQKQTRIIKSTITIEDGSLSIESSFRVPLSDHNISIPRIVNQKIATEIEVTVNAVMALH